MSDARATGKALPATEEPVHDAARRMRWFLAAFHSVRDRVEAETGLAFDLDEAALGRCFVRWLKKVEAGNPHSDRVRRAYFEHAAGMMLRELISGKPLHLRNRPQDSDEGRPEYFWPEGFCYTVFCMNVFAAAMRQDYGVDAVRADEFRDLRTWWTFRENVEKDKSYSIAFFKLFAGSSPNWQMPDVFRWPERDGIATDRPIPTPGPLKVPYR